MAQRPVFIPHFTSPPFYQEAMVEFEWSAGFSFSQKQKNVIALHRAAEKRNLAPVLEISTKSPDPLGVKLSAFNLYFTHPELGLLPVESAFQGSKVFEKGGPFTEFYRMTGREIRKDERLRNSGRLLYFDFAGERWGLEPQTAFYDWLYMNAVKLVPDLWEQLRPYRGFTDIEFNPQKSINCQARTAAIVYSLLIIPRLDRVLQDKTTFLSLVYGHSESKNTEFNQLTFL